MGVESEREYFDLKIYDEFREEYVERLNRVLPEGLKIVEAKTVPPESPSLSSFIQRYKYIVQLNYDFQLDQNKIESLTLKRQEKLLLLKDFLEEIKINGKQVCIIVKDSTDKARISEIVEAIFGKALKDLNIKRIAMYGFKGGWLEP